MSIRPNGIPIPTMLYEYSYDIEVFKQLMDEQYPYKVDVNLKTNLGAFNTVLSAIGPARFFVQVNKKTSLVTVGHFDGRPGISNKDGTWFAYEYQTFRFAKLEDAVLIKLMMQ